MSKVLALDIGGKRTGVAETDSLQMIASPRETIATPDLMSYLRKLFEAEEYSCIVVGDPISLQGGDSDNSQRVRSITAELRRQFPDKEIVLQDERFSSKLAVQSMLASGMKKKKRRDKSEIDKLSAAIILQDYLNS